MCQRPVPLALGRFDFDMWHGIGEQKGHNVMVITARRLEHSDLPDRVQWFGDERVAQQMSIDFPLSLADTQKWFSDAVLSRIRRDFTFTVAEPRKETVGMGGLTDLDERHRRAELYLVVKPGLTGRGIGRKVLRWLCNYGFCHVGLDKIYLYTLENNERARCLYTRHGFVEEGVLRRHVFHSGKWRDRHIQSLLREEWEDTEWANATVQASFK